MPRARMVTRAIASTNPYTDIESVDLASTALVETPVDLSGGSPGEARIVSDAPGDIVLETSAPDRQLLIVSERLYPGWRATVNGQPQPLVAVYGDFMGCVLEEGNHEVHLAFDPDNLRRGKRVSLAGVILTGIFGVFYARSRLWN